LGVRKQGGVDLVPEELYLDLLKKCLTRAAFPETYQPVEPIRGSARWLIHAPLRKLLAVAGFDLCRRVSVDPVRRAEGLDWPPDAETMIGLRRLENVERCILDVLRRKVPGDLIETGVWRGGATIFMRGVLRAYRETDRVVWAADSFQGLPKPDPASYAADRGVSLWRASRLACSLDDVKENFRRYGLLDEQVRFLVGWFRDTLPTAPIERLALLRLDGDMYESTIVALHALYPKLSPGGYVIVDDYNALNECKKAVDDFRSEYGVSDVLERIDRQAVFWQRGAVEP
jgi:O-methyltransferase